MHSTVNKPTNHLTGCHVTVVKSKAVSLLAMQALRGRGYVAPNLS
jgi:hypothetical protein